MLKTIIMRKLNLTLFLSCLILGGFFYFSPAKAQESEIIPDKITIMKARVLEVKSKDLSNVPGLEFIGLAQDITAEILEGKDKGKKVTFYNEYVQLKKGDLFYLNRTITAGDDREFFTVEDAYRLPIIYFFSALFIFLVLLIGGLQGVRGLLSLAGSLVLIIYLLLPGILAGYSPILVSTVVASLIIIVGSYVTHGFNKTTSSAVFGMIVTVIITGIMANVAVNMSHLSGYSSEEVVYLNLNTKGQIDIIGILIGGMMIGLLGILYDVAIGQAISVEELHHIAPHIERKKIFKRALRIGREHIGALINTLAIAYVGASLPLLLFFSYSSAPIDLPMTINREIFATEILRILIGSIGLVMAVPITTFLSMLMLVKVKPLENAKILKEENEKLQEHKHHH